jgi:hypothetical protein
MVENGLPTRKQVLSLLNKNQGVKPLVVDHFKSSLSNKKKRRLTFMLSTRKRSAEDLKTRRIQSSHLI